MSLFVSDAIIKSEGINSVYNAEARSGSKGKLRDVSIYILCEFTVAEPGFCSNS